MLFIFIIINERMQNQRLLEFTPDNINKYDKDKMYVLHQYPQKQYNNVTQCLLEEYTQESMFYYGLMSALSYYDEISEINITSLLVDINNDLTADEKFAIYLYTRQTPNMHGPMAEELPKGVTGKFNCYFNYLNKAFQKLKPLSQPKTLYRGSNNMKLSYSGTKIDSFSKGIYASTTSFTSTSTSIKSAIAFAQISYGPIIFIIKACRNPRDVSSLSEHPDEGEFLYPPSSRFLIKSDVYSKWCIYDKYYDKYDCNDTQLTDEYALFKFVELEEIDEEYGPFPIIKRPKSKKCISSCDNDEKLQISSKVLGNFNIQNIYIGASFVFDFDIGYSIMHSARKIFGHYIPAPNFLHPAIWVGSNESTGAVFVYGKYYPNNNEKSFLLKDGVKSYAMSFKNFKEKYDAFPPIKLIPGRNIEFFNFIEEIKTSGNWNAKDYKWYKNNCQHFIANCLKILRAVRFLPSENDWINLPSKIYKELKSNEKIFHT